MAGLSVGRVFAWEVLDSRGSPTVACEVVLANGACGSAIAPSGASTGSHEAHELRDGGERYGGRGVRDAVANVNNVLGPALVDAKVDAADQGGVDALLREVDGSAHLGNVGANAVLAVSVATLLATAAGEHMPLYRWVDGAGPPLLPMPMVNVLSGGAHAGRVIDVQDFLVVPVGARSFAEAIEWAWRVRRAAAVIGRERGLPTTLVADEGGLGFPLPSNVSALELLVDAIGRARLRPGDDVAVAIDVAATQFASVGGYRLAAEDRELDAAGLIDELASWVDTYPVVSLEDVLAEDDWDGWRAATQRLGARVQLLGDDLFVTDTARLERGAREGAANAVLVKPNQCGTISGARAVLDRARVAGFATVLSARSGDTEDAWLADLSVGWRTGQIKVGSLTRSERTAKWNRLLRIEAEAGDAVFAGRGALARQA